MGRTVGESGGGNGENADAQLRRVSIYTAFLLDISGHLVIIRNYQYGRGTCAERVHRDGPCRKKSI